MLGKRVGVALASARSSPTDTAIAGTPNCTAITAAPTVPELTTLAPRFWPRFAPDTTMSGRRAASRVEIA